MGGEVTEDDPIVARLLVLADKASGPQARLSYLLEAALRPGLRDFLKAHVLKHGGPKITEVPDIYMSVFANLSAELIENYMDASGEHAGARKSLRRFLKDQFARHLDRAVKARFETPAEPLRRANA